MGISDGGRQVYPSDISLPMISLVVSMRNEEPHIAECLECVLRQDYPATRLEIMVIDDMSRTCDRDIGWRGSYVATGVMG
jgi:cellulose synthase/poly-beta-1,6-N-acetylglucosamine synthase-like glycosyltransferase